MSILPNHIAIIMDGNGRWAQQFGKPRTFGHIKGARVAKKIITHSVEIGIKSLTLYAFSTENWMRPIEEVSFLMSLLNRYLRKERQKLVDQNIQFNVIGDISRLPEIVVKEIKTCREITKDNTGMKLTFALNYGGRQDIVEAVKSVGQLLLNQNIQLDDINEKLINDIIEKQSIGAPDLLIRTSGEIRLSNFLTWQSAYSELYFTNTLWPDFSSEDFDKALFEYNHRERRYGKTSAQVSIHDNKSAK